MSSQSEKYNLDYRPASYWGPRSLSDHFSSTIMGEQRRLFGLQELERGRVLNAGELKGALTETERTAVSAIHPWLMGGEYLPDVALNEVEIARIVKKSTTMDVVSIRARRTKRRIVYRIVDEYEDEGLNEYDVRPRTSTKPLMFRQLIAMIDGAIEGGLVGGGRAFNYEEGGGDPEELWDFETASSSFYPQLKAWYDERNTEWLAAILKEKEDEERENDEELDELPAKTPLQSCIEGATWAATGFGSGGGMFHAYQRALRFRAAKFYAEKYLEEYHHLPQGLHKVVVTYGPRGTADIETPMNSSSVGTLDIDIIYPTMP